MAKVYVLGATGGVGSLITTALLEKGVPTTILARDPSKAAKLFGESDKLNVVQGDYNNFDSFKSSIVGHERLFLMVNDFANMANIKITYAKIAFEAGVKQIVHLSSGSVSAGWRQNYISTAHFLAEQAIFSLPNRGSYVALRPTGFFSNHFLTGDDKTIRFKNSIFGSSSGDAKKPWISPTDIAQLAVNVLTEPIEKHGDSVYDMTSQLLSGDERAEILSRVLGKDIKYVQIPIEVEYKTFIEHAHMPHTVVYGLIDGNYSIYEVNVGLPIVLNRPTQKLEEWLQIYKEKFN